MIIRLYPDPPNWTDASDASKRRPHQGSHTAPAIDGSILPPFGSGSGVPRGIARSPSSSSITAGRAGKTQSTEIRQEPLEPTKSRVFLLQNHTKSRFFLLEFVWRWDLPLPGFQSLPAGIVDITNMNMFFLRNRLGEHPKSIFQYINHFLKWTL